MNIVEAKTASCLLSIHSLFLPNRTLIYFGWKCTQIKEYTVWASLVVQWLGICLPVQGTWVQALVREDSTCPGATKPGCHNY